MPRKAGVKGTWGKLCSSGGESELKLMLCRDFSALARFYKFPRLLAEEFDHVGRARARLTEGDPAVPAQREFLAPQDNLLVALDGDEGAVRAVIGEDELVQAALDLAVRTRSHALLHHQVGGLVASH